MTLGNSSIEFYLQIICIYKLFQCEYVLYANRALGNMNRKHYLSLLGGDAVTFYIKSFLGFLFEVYLWLFIFFIYILGKVCRNTITKIIFITVIIRPYNSNLDQISVIYINEQRLLF